MVISFLLTQVLHSSSEDWILIHLIWGIILVLPSTDLRFFFAPSNRSFSFWDLTLILHCFQQSAQYLLQQILFAHCRYINKSNYVVVFIESYTRFLKVNMFHLMGRFLIKMRPPCSTVWCLEKVLLMMLHQWFFSMQSRTLTSTI